LNDHCAGFADVGDTVIMSKATFFKKKKLEFRRVEYVTIFAQKSITFISPKRFPHTLSMNIGGSEMRWKSGDSNIINRILINENNQIFLNDVYQGDVFTNDTVILRPSGTLIIKKGGKDVPFPPR